MLTVASAALELVQKVQDNQSKVFVYVAYPRWVAEHLTCPPNQPR